MNSLTPPIPVPIGARLPQIWTKINIPSICRIVGFPYLLVNIVLVCVVLYILLLSVLDALVLYVNHINVIS